MSDIERAAELATTEWSDVLSRTNVMDMGIRPLWDSPRIAGPAYTVKCAPGHNLMLHAAIHRAPRGSVVVVEAGDVDYALAGGNVCAVAQRNGIAGFVVDGVIRDLAEVREIRFPVFARGVIPIPGGQEALGVIGHAVTVGGATVRDQDIVVADEEGVVVIPSAEFTELLAAARATAAREAVTNLDDWAAAHDARISGILASKGYREESLSG
jgi:4-hydroxy-4-methyl-2-oxoglutarate aldolase